MGNKYGSTDLSSAESEERFRGIFLSHLESEGYSETDVHRMIFKTPAGFNSPPADASGLELLGAFRRHYQNQLPFSWYFGGLHQRPARVDCDSETPSRPVTFIVIPGIFGEFIDQLPFQEVLDESESRFSRKWRPALEQAQDQTFSLLDLEEAPRNLAQLVGTGSIEHGDQTLCNVIVLKAESGSLETLGSLESNAAVYSRRLEKVFKVVDSDTDIFIIGYSRGLAVALELVSRLHQENRAGTISPANKLWFENLKGVIGLGGVFYGAKFAQDVLEGNAGDISDLVSRLRNTAEARETVPDGASIKEKAVIVKRNLSAWTGLMKGMSDAEKQDVARGKSFLKCDLQGAFVDETRFRLRRMALSKSNAHGIIGLVTSFLKKTFPITGTVAGYNRNTLALKRLVQEVIVALNSLTPETRDAWWRSHELPEDLALFSLTGTMPDIYLNGFHSPLLGFEGFGPKSSDFNAVLRSSFYDTTASENTQLNDSQVAHFASRYWEQMYPEHRYAHYYLGVLGTHHFGMGFPYMIEDDHGNGFPRATLLKAISSFICSLRDPDGSLQPK